MTQGRLIHMEIRLYERMIILKHRINRMYVSLTNVALLHSSRERGNNWDEGKKRDMNEYLEEEIRIRKVEHPATAKKMLGEEDEAEDGEGDNQGGDKENGFGVFDHDKEDVSNCGDESDNNSRNGKYMLGLKLPVYGSPMAKLG